MPEFVEVRMEMADAMFIMALRGRCLRFYRRVLVTERTERRLRR
jgi:hypothetical protein